MTGLKKKAVTGVFWSLLEKFGLTGVKFIMGIILARLLRPEAFGLIGMIMVFFAVAEVFVKSGFGLAYIQKEQVDDRDANTIFFTNLTLSLFLYSLLFIGAPLIARFYEEPQLVKLTRVMGLVIVIDAFNIIQRAKVKRAVNFKKQTTITLISTLFSGIAGITGAFMGLGVWALALRSMSNRTFIAAGFWLTTKWRPKWQFSKKSFREMFSFGSWMLFSSIIRKIFDNIYVLTIGKYFAATQLGYFTKAQQFQRLVSQNLANSIGSVAFPVYSRLQNDNFQLQQAMKKFLQHSMFFLLPLSVMLIVVARPFILLILTEKWAPMIPYLQLLCVIGIFYPINMINTQALTAKGHSRLAFKINMVINCLRLINIFISSQFGIAYIIIGEIIINCINLIIFNIFITREVGYNLLTQLNDVKEIILSIIIGGSIGYFSLLHLKNLWLDLFLGGFITLASYILIQLLINRHFIFSVLDLKGYLGSEK